MAAPDHARHGIPGEVKDADVCAVVEKAREGLAMVPAFDVRLGPAVLDPEAVLLRVHPDGSVRRVRDIIRAAAEPIAQVLSGLDLEPSRARISRAELRVLHRDNRTYEWESYARVPLG